MPVYVQLFMCAHPHGGQRSAQVSLLRNPPCGLRQCPVLVFGAHHRLGSLACKPQRSFRLYLPRTGCEVCDTTDVVVDVDSGIELRSSQLSDKHFTN